MSITPDLSKLSSSAIADLYAQTRREYIRQRDGVDEAEVRPKSASPASGGLHFVNGSYCSCQEGLASHAVEPERYYQSESGCMVKLEPGEERPASLEDERTERLIRMPQNEVDNLGPEAHAELMEFREGILEQRSQEFLAARPKYNPTDENKEAMLEYLGNTHLGYVLNDDDELMLTLLTRGCYTVKNLCAAYDHLSRRGELTPLPGDVKKLDAQQTLELSAMCSTARTDDDFENILDQYLLATTGSNRGARRLVLDPRYVKAVSEGVYFIFANSTPEFQETAEAKQFLKRYVGNRFVSVRLLRAGLAAYLRAKEKGEIEQEQTVVQSKPSPEEETLQKVNDFAREISRASWQGL